MLLNPGRAESPKADAGRSSGGFTGLVRHVIELSAVGELPLALDDVSAGEEDVDEPVGCAIEYLLPSGQVSQQSGKGGRAEVGEMWDGDVCAFWWLNLTRGEALLSRRTPGMCCADTATAGAKGWTTTVRSRRDSSFDRASLDRLLTLASRPQPACNGNVPGLPCGFLLSRRCCTLLLVTEIDKQRG